MTGACTVAPVRRGRPAPRDLGTVFFSRFGIGRLPTDGLATTAWVCLVPRAITAQLIFRLPMHARQEQ